MQLLQREFYSSYDPSLHSALATAFSAGKFQRTEVLLGEGRHFRAWKVLVGPGRHQVLTLSNSAFETERGSGGLQRWLRAMKVLQTANLSLVPPLAVVQLGAKISVMMPFGTGKQTPMKVHWQHIDQHIEQLTADLHANRLKLDDHIQIKVSDGVPFVCDFSDLYLLPTAN
jgi:hypothetical protein